MQRETRNGSGRLPVYRYRLIDRDGNDLGLFVTGFEDWHPGRVVLQTGGDFEVTAVVEAEPGGDCGAYLVVDQVSYGR